MTALRCKVLIDDVAEEVSSVFDYTFDGESVFHVPQMPDLPRRYGIGLIVGPSGSGKTSLLRRFGEVRKVYWSEKYPIVSHFGSSEEAIACLSAVGLNSIPSWMRPFHVLSTGEQFRADLARRLDNNAVIDEFTSVVDRTVAKACSHSIRRYVDKAGLRNLVFASCHYDIIEWLQPDWVFDTTTKQLSSRGVVRRPPIELEIIPCGRQTWTMFAPHHYLDGNLNRTARCWIATWDEKPVAFAAALPFPNGNFKNAWRGHRTVVLPDYQGLGIGVRLSDAIAEHFVSQGHRYFSKTSHPRMGAYRENSPRWRATSKNRKSRQDYKKGFGVRRTKEDGHKLRHVDRVCFSHEYIGDDL